MRCVGIAVLFMVCLLHLAGGEVLAQEREPAEPDTASASDIYNPPRVITPEYEAGPVPSGETQVDLETQAPEPQPEAERGPGKPCTTCRRGSRERVGGGGEFSGGYLFCNLDDINRQVRQMGIPALSDDIILVGGRGYTRIGHLILGAAGYAGDSESSGIPDCCARYARVEIAYGGLLIGLALSQPRYEVMAGMLFGGGQVEILRERNSRSVAGWYEAWENFGEDGPDSVATDDLNVTSKIAGEFIALEPFAEVKYWVLPFMAVGFSASHLDAEVGRGEWKLDGVAIPDSPESNIGGWSLRLGLHFGM